MKWWLVIMFIVRIWPTIIFNKFAQTSQLRNFGKNGVYSLSEFFYFFFHLHSVKSSKGGIVHVSQAHTWCAIFSKEVQHLEGREHCLITGIVQFIYCHCRARMPYVYINPLLLFGNTVKASINSKRINPVCNFYNTVVEPIYNNHLYIKSTICGSFECLLYTGFTINFYQYFFSFYYFKVGTMKQNVKSNGINNAQQKKQTSQIFLYGLVDLGLLQIPIVQ